VISRSVFGRARKNTGAWIIHLHAARPNTASPGD
jgi:hypothetical protein